MQFRDLVKQYNALQSQINQAIHDVVAGGQYIMGQQVAELEKQLSAYVGTKHCITCANGTDALTLALKAWGIGKGDAVFVPDFTFFSTAEVAALEGATPVFVDVDTATFNIDPQSLEDCIRRVKEEGAMVPRVIVAVNLFGLPANSKNKEVSWSVTQDSPGVIMYYVKNKMLKFTAMNEGVATVTAYATKNPSARAECKIIVSNDEDAICAQIIDVLYGLRCKAAHGEIEYSQAIMPIYEHAFTMLNLITKKFYYYGQ